MALVKYTGACLDSIYVSKVFDLSLLCRHLEFRLRVHVAYRGNKPYMS
jgi:hypothetical protein